MRYATVLGGWGYLSVAGAVALITVVPQLGTAAESSNKRRDAQQARATVQEALQSEIYGLASERQSLLERATELDSRLASPHWHLGQIQTERGDWQAADDYQLLPKQARQLDEYRKLRDDQPDTVEAHWKLANWCASHGLAQQERAHLSRLLDLAPDHLEARARLGYVRVGNDWFNREQAVAAQQRQKQLEEALVKWRPVVGDILADLHHRSELRRQKALERLGEITDEGAAPAIEQVMAAVGEEEAKLAVEQIAKIKGQEATFALCRQAFSSPNPVVRQLAGNRLRQRDQMEYVPWLLVALSKPIESKFAAIVLPNGKMTYKHIFVREGQQRRDVVLLDTEYERRALAPFEPNGPPPGNKGNTTNPYAPLRNTPKRQARDTTMAALTDAARNAAIRERIAMQQNELIRQLNDRIMEVLAAGTGKAFNDPGDWWEWWAAENHVIAGPKRTNFFADQDHKVVTDRFDRRDQEYSNYELQQYLPPTTTLYQMPPFAPQCSCFAAGTPVWTIDGPQPIEQLRVGDMVLAKDVNTGELAYKPVLRTTVRPPSPLWRLGVGGEVLQVTSGHLFWVSGEGWRQAHELEVGQILHTLRSPLRVTSNEETDTAETYNLVVADFYTYFVGESKVLTHDVSYRRPTAACVPGLLEE